MWHVVSPACLRFSILCGFFGAAWTILFLCCLLLLCYICVVSSVLGQEIGWEEHLRNDLVCVECDVKP